MTLTVGGLTSIHNPAANSNYDTPTNPKITSSSSFSGRTFGIIYTDDTVDTTIEKVGATLLTEFSNLDNTNGHTIRCYDGTNGVDLSSIDLTTDTYFVLVHSDDSNMHHFAKVESIETADEAGDSFTFEPKLGNRVTKGTKFMIFKGPTITNSSKIIAITCGLDDSGFSSEYVVSRPLWYFYNEKTVKDNELDHNTKYFAKIKNVSSGNSVDLDGTSEKVSFVTMIETHYRIIDSSKFSYVVKLTDRLKIKDDPDTATSNESAVLTGTYTTYTDYNDCFINARRDSDDNYSTLSLNGLTRYTHYRDSPTKSNLLNNVYDSYVEESIDGKAGYSETKIIDNNQILGKKISTNQEYIIRQAIGRGSFNDWVQVGEIDSFAQVLGTNYTYNLRNPTYGVHINISEYFNINDEIRIGDRVCIVSGRSGNRIVFRQESRLLTEGSFTTTFNMLNLESGAKVYRRAFNMSNSNLLTPIKFEDNSLERLRVVLYSDSAQAIEATVVDYQTPLTPHTGVNIDNTYQLLYLNFEDNFHDSDDNGLEYVEGDYVILYEVFTGKIEKISKKIENGNNIVTISGRNTFNKLVNPIINKDNLYSLDAIYSSRSPYKRITALGANITTDLQSKTITFGSSLTLAEGTEFWVDDGFIGKLSAAITSATSGTLEDYPLIGATSKIGYKTVSNQLIFNKAMASNLSIDSSTDLSGAANKGLSFRDGVRLTLSGAEDINLAGTSSSSEAKAIGYNIDQTDSISTSDSVFLAKDTVLSSNETVNTLLDFTIISIREEASNKTVKLAPYIPITLGRSHPNFRNEEENTFTTIGTTTLAGSSAGIVYGTFTHYSIPYHTPIFVNGKFVGRFLYQSIQPSTSPQDSYLLLTTERPLFNSFDSGDTIQMLSSKTHHELHLINGGHLHGGKTIGLLGTNNNILEFETFDNSTFDSYTDKFGKSIFRIFNLEKGKIGYGKLTSGNDYITPDIREPPMFNYYATSFKGRNAVKYNKYGLTDNTLFLPIERRGLVPITYSNYYGRILPNSSSLNVSKNYRVLSDQALNSGMREPISVENTLYQPSPNAARLFLFANCDIYPYSSTRTDSLLNSATRNIEKYGLLTMGEIKETNSSEDKEGVSGQTRKITLLDSSYSHSSIISSNKTLSSLKRLGLMRLTELVTDFAYNPINPEEPIKENYLRQLRSILNYDVDIVLGGSISSVSDYGSFTGRSVTVTLSGTPTNLFAGDLLVDLVENVIWAEVNSVSSADVNITVNHLSNNGALYTGSVYKISTSDYDSKNQGDMSGLEANTVIFKINNEEKTGIHPNKVMVFADAGGFCDTSIVPNNKFDDKYSEKLLKISRTFQNYGMISPFIFSEEYNSNMFLVERLTQSCTSNSSTTLTVADSSAIEIGAYIGPGAIGETTNFGIPAGTYVTAKPTATTVTLNQAATASYGPANLTFINKKPKKNFHLSRIFKQLDYANLPTVDYTEYGYGNVSRQSVVLLKDYSVEKGTTVQAGQVHGLGGLSLENVNDGSRDIVVPLYDDCKYGVLGNSVSDNDYSVVGGAFAGLKFHIFSKETGSSASSGEGFKAGSGYPAQKKAVGNKTYYEYKVSHKGKYNFLQFLDLTGCYLAPIRGKNTQNEDVGTDSSDVHIDDLVYIVSHTYDTITSLSDDEDYSYLIMDKDITGDSSGTQYKILHPNPVCMWDRTPKDIYLNHLSKRYTKVPDSDRMYGTDITDYQFIEGNDPDRTGGSNNSQEAILSMYAVIDLDDIGQSNNTVLKNRNELRNITTNDGFSREMCISDGENTFTSDIKFSRENNGNAHLLRFERTKYLEGAVSITEPFELKVNGDIKIDDKRAIIGSTLDISREAEELVEELFTENDITYSLVSSSYPIYASPDFQGTSLYSLAKYLLNLKDKTLFDNAGTISSRSILDSNSITKFEFNDNNIIEYELTESGFDFYNEVIVYGSSHKAIKKNVRSIKEIGKKTLEIFDKKLKSQADVDRRGFELLNIHNNETSNLEVKAHIRDAETISSGDIVIVEIKQENIPRNLYMVLEMKYEISGLTTLVLGKYRKGMEDRFSELILANKQTDSYIRRKDFSENDLVFDFFENLKIKELNLTIRKRTQTGITLGFSHTLNTQTSTIGFGGGTVSHETLLEEDL